jgi:hypothetical protein
MQWGNFPLTYGELINLDDDSVLGDEETSAYRYVTRGRVNGRVNGGAHDVSTKGA